MTLQMEKAGPPGAIGVASAARAPPEAVWIACPPAAPEPMNEPISARIALISTTLRRSGSREAGIGFSFVQIIRQLAD